MVERIEHKNRQQILFEIRRLLRNQKFNTEEFKFVNSDNVSVAYHPSDSQLPERKNVYLNIHLFEKFSGMANFIGGTVVQMQKEQGNQEVVTSNINWEGQVEFKDLKEGNYSITIERPTG